MTGNIGIDEESAVVFCLHEVGKFGAEDEMTSDGKPERVGK